MNLLDAFKQYIRDAMPGGALNPEVTTQGVLDAAALGTAPVPVLGDAIGLAADVKRLKDNPGERTPMNFGLAALGALPFVPGGLAGMFVGKGAKTWDAISAAKAKELADKGVDARQIWKETGTFKGPDGAWRQEIDDSAAKLRDYQYTPQEAYKNAKETAWINEDTALAGRVKQMQPYVGMSKNQLKEEYRRTGGEIVDAAVAGDKAKALQLTEGRAGLDYLLGQMSDRKYGPASAYLSHGDLGKAYPDVYKLHTRIDGDADSLGAYLRADTGRGEQMVLKRKPMWSEDKSTMLHELQHAIQQREGWARGGSPQSMTTEYLRDQSRLAELTRKLEKAQNAASDESRWAKPDVRSAAVKWYDNAFGDFGKADPIEEKVKEYLLSQDRIYQDLYKEHATLAYPTKGGVQASVLPEERYRRLAGEAEARATQARMNLNAQQRRELFPLDSYDVPVDQLIIRGGLLDGPAMAIDPVSKKRLIDDLASGTGAGTSNFGIFPGNENLLRILERNGIPLD